MSGSSWRWPNPAIESPMYPVDEGIFRMADDAPPGKLVDIENTSYIAERLRKIKEDEGRAEPPRDDKTEGMF
jgi:hypothetical protein